MGNRTPGTIRAFSPTPISEGGTGARTATDARTNLGVENATKEFTVYVARHSADAAPYSTIVGNFPVAVMSSTADVEFTFYVPNDFTSLTDAAILALPDATETIQWDVTAAFGANGEQHDANTDSIIDDTLAVTATEITELDVSAALTSIAAGDHAGLRFESDTTNIEVSSLRIRYS